jgi:hypothetical protein
MPGLHRAVEVKLPEAEVLADLYSVRYDLEIATHLSKAAREAGATRPHDSLLVEGLVTAALIRYCRCFSTNVRLGLRRTDIAGLDDETLGHHDYFKALRDKFVAHSANPFEENWVTASATERDGVRYPITSVAHGSHRMLLSVGEARALGALVKQVRYVVDAKIKAEEERLLAVIQQLPPDVLHDSDLRTPARFSLTDVGHTRKQTRALTTRLRPTRKSGARPQRGR